MKKPLILPVLITIGLIFLLAGCGTQDNSPVAATGRGVLKLTIRWPQSSVISRVIPPAAQSIVVTLRVGRLTIARQSVPHPPAGQSTSTITFPNLPTAQVTVVARAYDAVSESATLLASGESTITVVPDATTSTNITLTPTPPPIANEQYIIGGSISPDPAIPGQIHIALSALLSGSNGRPLSELTAANFVVMEDDIQRQVTSAQSVSVTNSKADIAFAIDTTGSMDPEIAGVRDSVVALVQGLAQSHVDVRVAGVSFGDDIRDVFDFTGDTAQFRAWVQTLTAEEGGDTPENDLDAIMRLADGEQWRPDAQHIIIALTDAPVHQNGDGSGFTINTLAGVSTHLAGRFTLYAISPGLEATRAFISNTRSNSSSFVPAPASRQVSDSDLQFIAEHTGGQWIEMPSDGVIDLNTLPISSTILSGYTVTYLSTPTDRDHRIRLVVNVDGLPVADQFFSGHY